MVPVKLASRRHDAGQGDDPCRGRGIGRNGAPLKAKFPMDRSLPHNLEAEKCVLGAILINNQAFNNAAEVIDAQDFSAMRTGASSRR